MRTKRLLQRYRARRQACALRAAMHAWQSVLQAQRAFRAQVQRMTDARGARLLQRGLLGWQEAAVACRQQRVRAAPGNPDFAMTRRLVVHVCVHERQQPYCTVLGYLDRSYQSTRNFVACTCVTSARLPSCRRLFRNSSPSCARIRCQPRCMRGRSTARQQAWRGKLSGRAFRRPSGALRAPGSRLCWRRGTRAPRQSRARGSSACAP